MDCAMPGGMESTASTPADSRLLGMRSSETVETPSSDFNDGVSPGSWASPTTATLTWTAPSSFLFCDSIQPMKSMSPG